MPNAKNDRRIRYTKYVLRQALLHLMKSNSIDKITVTDICRQADINRGTFYAHYSDPTDLLHQIEDEFYNEIQDSLQRNYPEAGMRYNDKISFELLQHIAENSALCMILLGKHGDADFLKRVLRIAQEPMYEIWAKNSAGIAPMQHEYRYSFIANGSLGVIQHWIQGGMKEKPVEIADLINKLVIGIDSTLLP